MDNPIADKVAVCLQSFQKLCSALLQPNLDFSKQIPLPKVKDEFSRFKVWSGNIGAHRSGRSSLNYRLRDASHLRRQIISLLDDLNQSLGDAASIVLGETIPWDETLLSEDTFDRDNSEKPAGDDLMEDSILATTELNQILLDIVEVVNCLLRLSVAIRNPAPHDRLMKSKSTDTSHYEPYDIQHVCMKFPGADKKITARLGKVISRRRQYFKYREEHHNKLSQGLDFNSGMTEIVGPSTIASSLPQHIKGGAGVAGDLGTLDEDERSETGISQTSYATSVANSEQICVPPLPKQSKDGPFECPFCFMIISTSTPLSWKKHVFKDLRPYICLWKDCLTADQEFSRRHEWMEHVMQKHWRTWHCAYGCQDTFPSASEFKQHISRSHSDAVATTQLDALASLSERRMALDVVMECPLCSEKVKSVKQYHRHVGRHQEELALFALPKITGPDEVEAEQHDSQGQPIESIGSGNPGEQSDGDRSGLSSASAAAEHPQQDEQDDDNPVEETDGNSGYGAGGRSRTDYDNSVTKEQWLEGFGNEDGTVEAAASGYAPSVLSVPPYNPFTEIPALSNQPVPFSGADPYRYSQNPFSPPLGPGGNPFSPYSAATNAASGYYPYGTPQYGVPPMYYFQPPPAHTPAPPPAPPPPPPPNTRKEEEDARLKKIERLLLGQRDEEDKKQEDARFAKLEQVLFDRQEGRVRKEEGKKRAAEEAAVRAAEVKKKGDEDKLAKLEKLILAQKDEQLKREAQAQAQAQAQVHAQAAQGQAQQQILLRDQAGGIDIPQGQQQSPAMSFLTRPMAPPGQQGGTTPQQRPAAQGHQLNPQVRARLIPPGLPDTAKQQLMSVSDEDFRAVIRRLSNVPNNANQTPGFPGNQPQIGQPSMPMNPQDFQMGLQENQLMNSANINTQRTMQLGQQAPGSMNPQRVQLQQAQQQQAQQQQHRRMVLAQQTLKQNPHVITKTDQKPFPPNILSPMVKQNLPEGVKTWAQLKEWASRNPALAPNIDTGKLLLLQAMHVQDLLHQQQNMSGQRIPPQSNNVGAVPNAQPGGQAPQAQGMPPHPPVTPQDIQNLRARLPPAQARLTDDQLRKHMTNQRMVQWKKQQAQRLMQQGLQDQANQIPQQPMPQ